MGAIVIFRCVSDVDLRCYLDRVIDLDAEVTNGALGVAEQEPGGSSGRPLYAVVI
jgi:hypothetical protein